MSHTTHQENPWNKVMDFMQAQYKYICHKSDNGFRYEYPDKEKSRESNEGWLLCDHKGRYMAIVNKETGKVIE